MGYPESIIKLIESFEKLPGIGEKSAERLAFSIIDSEKEDVELFAEALKAVKNNIKTCVKCNHITEAETCDLCLGKLIESANTHFFDVVVTADHGNAEFMMDRFNNIVTSHTTNEVPFIICNNKYH